MKKILVLLMLAMPFAVQAQEHHGDHGAPAAAEKAKHDGPVVHVGVNGMVCDFCAQSLVKTFKKNEAVQDIDVSLEKKLVTIYLKKGMSLEDKVIQVTVVEAGYAVEGIHRMPEGAKE
jgi:copper chaperone CopZ